MATRNASAQWNGTLREGNGNMAVGSGAFEGPFTFRSRFEGDSGTNPEELIGAAIAGCYSMQLGAMLGEAGNPADSVKTEAKVHLRQQDGLPTITQIELVTRVRASGLDDAALQETASAAEQACLVARALGGVGEITVDAKLEG
jgi:osmotically inducible protein OsmC